ncbi:MAG: hypothetical protein KAS73_06180 [Candidatus Sabulitectum sp.]|nr:hypothetical protein [Candidatus Sabulitectum sp.]
MTDSIGNWGGIVARIFLGLAIFNSGKKRSYRLAAFFSIGYVVYEFVQNILPKGVFDWNDVFGTVIGFLISAIILLVVWRVLPVADKGD